MTEAQKSAIEAMMVSARNEFEFCESGGLSASVRAIQAYTSCLVTLQLDRIATALERPVPNYDPNTSTALNRIASAVEGMEDR